MMGRRTFGEELEQLMIQRTLLLLENMVEAEFPLASNGTGALEFIDDVAKDSRARLILKCINIYIKLWT